MLTVHKAMCYAFRIRRKSFSAFCGWETGLGIQDVQSTNRERDVDCGLVPGFGEREETRVPTLPLH